MLPSGHIKLWPLFFLNNPPCCGKAGDFHDVASEVLFSSCPSLDRLGNKVSGVRDFL